MIYTNAKLTVWLKMDFLTLRPRWWCDVTEFWFFCCHKHCLFIFFLFLVLLFTVCLLWFDAFLSSLFVSPACLPSFLIVYSVFIVFHLWSIAPLCLCLVFHISSCLLWAPLVAFHVSCHSVRFGFLLCVPFLIFFSVFGLLPVKVFTVFNVNCWF